MVLLFKNYDQWWMYMLMALVSILVLWLVMRRSSRVPEYLSAYSVNVQHHEPWTEKVVRHTSYTDSKGHTRTRTVVEYRRHPDVWLMCMNTGVSINITCQVYEQMRTLWKTRMQWINPPHINCVKGGGGQLYEWNQVYEDAATHTYKGLYINYVVNSNSIFRLGHVSKKEAKELGLIDYPKFWSNELDHNVILTSSRLPDSVWFSQELQRAFQLI